MLLLRCWCCCCCCLRSDETILPTDHKKAGQIVDDELNALLVRPLAQGVTLHALMDCCHSGTVLDLPYRVKEGPPGSFKWKVGRWWGRAKGWLCLGQRVGV
jgi:hypothetical protein